MRNVVSDYSFFKENLLFNLLSSSSSLPPPNCDEPVYVFCSIFAKIDEINKTILGVMGNQVIAASNPIYISPELKWKSDSAKREHSIPYSIATPGAASAAPATNETVFNSIAFKEHLLANIDSDYLISSVLSSAANDDKILLEGIKQCNACDADAKKEISAQIELFEQCANAGINVRLNVYFYSTNLLLMFVSLSVSSLDKTKRSSIYVRERPRHKQEFI